MNHRPVIVAIVLVIILALLALVVIVTALGVARHQRRRGAPRNGDRTRPKDRADEEADVDSPEGWRRHARPDDADPD